MNTEDRHLYLGGSEVAGALGLSRWNTPLQVWAHKTGQIEPKDISGKEEVELGLELEDYVAKRFMRITGKKVQRVNETLFHKDYPFLGANIDRRVVGENSVLECKTASVWKYKEWEGEDIPQEYMLQVLHYMLVGGFTKGYIACLIGNHKFVWKEIVFDQSMLDQLLKKELHFWNTFVIPRVMPVQIMAQDSGTLSELYKVQQGKEINLTDDANKLIESLDSLKADSKVLEKEIEEQENRLKIMLGENEIGLTGNYRVVWKLQTQRRLSTDLVKQEFPAVYEKCARPIEFRKLNIYDRKDKK
jgi:putative phage-type endonuclease